MVIDTSALVAIVLDEPERHSFDSAIAYASRRLLSATNLTEARIVLLCRKGEAAVQVLDSFVVRAGIEVCTVTTDEANLAFDAYRRYGKGIHPAGLNFGDCFAYALSKSSGEPLLFKGGDFALTDVVPVTP